MVHIIHQLNGFMLLGLFLVLEHARPFSELSSSQDGFEVGFIQISSPKGYAAFNFLQCMYWLILRHRCA